MTARPRLLPLLLLVVSAGKALALDPSLAVTQYVHSVWRAPQTLPHDDVTAIVQARSGYLWIGTVEGLARFDGVRSVVFDKSNTPALANNWIKALLEDRAGRLWIGTFGGGLVLLENGRFVRFGAERGLPSDIVLSLHEDGQGRVWVGTVAAGFFRLEGGRFERVAGTEAAAESNIRAFVEDRDGTLWIGADDGLYRLRGGTLTRLTREHGLSDDKVISLAEDESGLWIGTEKGGLNHLAGAGAGGGAPPPNPAEPSSPRIRVWSTRNGLSHDRVWCLERDRQGNVWIGTDGGGLDRLSPDGRLAAFTTKNGLTNDYVWSILEDREGSLWIATNGGGLNRLKEPRIVPLTTREGLPSDFTWAIRRTRDGSLWIGTEDAGLAQFRDGRVTVYSTREGLANNQVKALLEGRDGGLWIGGDGGLAVLRDGRIQRLPLPGPDNPRINALAEDAGGTLWIGTAYVGLMSLRQGRLERFRRADGLSSENVNFLLAARDGAIWIATTQGLDRLAGGRIVSFRKAQGLPNDYVTSILEDETGTIWAATRGGLARIREGRVDAVTVRHGLFDDAIMLAVAGADGSIWMGGNRGLSRVWRRDLDDVLSGRRLQARSVAFDVEDGMRSVEVNGSGSSGWRDPDGRLWFATRVGVVSVDPSRLVRNETPPPVVIEEALADGRRLEGRGPWVLPAGTRRIELRFTALSLLSPLRVRLRKRLVGFDGDFVDVGSQRSADYTNLAHGSYRFQVIAANEDGVWSEPDAGVAFEIEPRLHERLLFRVLAVLVFAVAGPLFYLVRVRRLRRQKTELERLVAARTAEVQAANARLAQLAREDGLTGVANRRSFDEALDEEWRRAHRMRTPLSLLLLDVDAFKAYNDQLGHQEGDACLKAVARTLAETHQRAGELVARYGGEEFVALLPGVGPEQAVSAAENVRRRVQELALHHPASPTAQVVTVSVGVSSAEPWMRGSAGELVGAADRALYRAKRGGRNRVESDGPVAAPPSRSSSGRIRAV